MSETTTTTEPEAVTPAAPAPEPEVPETPSAAPSEAPAEAAAPEAERPAKKPWHETRISQLTARNAALEREAEEARRIAAAAVRPADGDAPNSGLVPEAEIDRRAREIVARQQLETKLADWADRGNREFGDFNQRCATVAGLGLAPQERPEFMQIIADMPDGHKVVAHLADHPDRAMALAREPVHKMAMALASLSTELSRPPPVSRAPAPITPVATVATPNADIYDPSLSSDRYYALRAEQRAKRRR